MLVSLFAVMFVDVCWRFRRRCSCKVCFTVVHGAESHAGSHRSAAPIAGGVAAKVGVGESPGPSTGILLTEQATDGEDDTVRPHASTEYICEGTICICCICVEIALFIVVIIKGK